MSLIKKVIIGVFLLLFSYISFAAKSTNLKINSDNLTIKQDKLSATFSGSVSVIFDNLRLSTTKLIIFYTDLGPKKEIRKIVIPSKLKAIKDCGKEIIIADRGEFDNLTKKLTLEGNVKMEKEGDILVTNKLVYSSLFKSINQDKDAK